MKNLLNIERSSQFCFFYSGIYYYQTRVDGVNINAGKLIKY